MQNQTKLDISVGLVSVAIGELYVSYWENLVVSAESQLAEFPKITAHVFSNLPEAILDISKRLNRVSVVVHPVPHLDWPEATLSRFEFFSANPNKLAEDCLIYLDADMEIVSPITRNHINYCLDEDVLLVDHPGFYRPQGILNKALLYFRNPKMLLSDVLLRLKYGELGNWETRRESSAFLTRSARKNYVCGGTWMASRQSFLEISSKLAEATSADRSSGIIAKWHDESHLNRLQGESDFSRLPPSWCFVEGARNLAGLSPIIVAIEKGTARNR